MSWNVYLYDDRGHLEYETNYTHNVNGMASAALKRAGYELPDDTRPCTIYDRETRQATRYPNGHGTISWWRHLDGMTGADGAAYLNVIIRQFEAEPAVYRAMNPENGWGDFDSFLELLKQMRAVVPEWPTSWSTSG